MPMVVRQLGQAPDDAWLAGATDSTVQLQKRALAGQRILRDLEAALAAAAGRSEDAG